MASAEVILAQPKMFSAKEIDAFERTLLADPHATERDASYFFASHPAFLHMGVGAESRREVVMLGSKTSHRVDFFRRSYGHPYWDVIELKRPTHPVTAAGSSLHPRLSSVADAAISQALDYRDHIVSDVTARAQLADSGIAVCRPRLIVVVGQDPQDIEPEQFEILLDRVRARGPVELLTYTAIHRFAVEHYKSAGPFVGERKRVENFEEHATISSEQYASKIEQIPVPHNSEIAIEVFAEIPDDIVQYDSSKQDRIRATLAENIDAARTVVRLFVGNMPLRLEDAEARAIFEEIAQTVDFFWPNDRETGRKKGFAFVDVDETDVGVIVERMNGREIMGRHLVVNRARPRDER